jgi:hypothetical protein
MATTTISGSTTRNNGATVLGGGNIDTSTNTVSSAPSLKSFLDNHSHVVGSRVLASTGTKWKSGITTGKGSGTLAYQPTKEDPQFLIRHVASKVNNISNTVLYSGASDKAGRRAINHLAKNHRYDITSIDYKTGIATKGGSAGDAFNYVQVGDGTTAATDDAATPTRAIPGELVYMYGALTPKQDDYKAKTGG